MFKFISGLWVISRVTSVVDIICYVEGYEYTGMDLRFSSWLRICMPTLRWYCVHWYTCLIC
jgi:hypothetical protein